ncbi:SLAM family member 5-like [Clupea harengus]|uniref:SLAM family member 5-like n=1 Tax=Clupea harengus TaxID=7950 RepID=A0A6P8GUY9_CLUHA|nr:SLAM family member 5-like [Clupea harengus]
MKQQVWILFFLAVPLCSSVPVYNAEVNGDVTLSPVGISSVRSVVWKFGNNKVAEFDPSFSKEVKIFGNYQGRTTLDKETGKITISKLSLKDNGTFSVEVDSVLTSGWYRLEVFEAVKTVEITRDDTDKKLCKLLCKAENALNLEWSASHSENFNSTGSHLTVRKSDLSHSYTCNASNPVSRMTTTVKAKDICQDPIDWGPIVGGILGVLAVIGAGAAGGVLLYQSRADAQNDESKKDC